MLASLTMAFAVLLAPQDDEFEKAVSKVAGMTNYSFTMTNTIKNGDDVQGGGINLWARYDKEAGYEGKGRAGLVYTKDGKTVYKTTGDWTIWKSYGECEGDDGERVNALTPKLPTRILPWFAKRVKSVEKKKLDDGGTLFTGSTGKMRGYDSLLKVWVDRSGNIARFEMVYENDQMHSSSRFDFSHIGQTRIEIPQEALRLLGGKKRREY